MPPVRALLAVPGFGRLLASSLVARLQSAMMGLALVLYVVGGGGSYAAAGAASACWSVAAGVATPLLSRTVHRRGLRRVLLPAAAVTAAASVLLGVVPPQSTVLLCVVAAVTGLSTPPITPATRGLWPRLLRHDGLLRQGYALEASVQELIYVVGPALVGLLVAVGPAGLALGVAGGLTLAGTAVLVTGSGVAAAERAPAPAPVDAVVGAGSGRPRVLLLLGVGLLLVAGFGASEVAVAGIATDEGAAGAAGGLLACWAVGSLVGGLTFGARLAGSTPLRRLPMACLAVGGGIALVSTGPGLVGVGLLLVLAGAAIAPALTCLYLAVEQVARGRATELFGWLSSAFLAGGALGAALGGVLVESFGARRGLLLAGLAPLCAAAVGWTAGRVGSSPAPPDRQGVGQGAG